MSDRSKKYGNWASGIGLIGGVILTVVFPPVAGLVGKVALTAGMSAIGKIAGNAVGAGTDTVLKNINAPVVQILGPSQVGKNSVYNTITGERREVNRTAPGTKSLYYGRNKMVNELNETGEIWKQSREVSGETLGIWDEVLEMTNPHGIIYVTDSITTNINTQSAGFKNRFAKEVEGLERILNCLAGISNRRAKAIVILVNKIDLKNKSNNGQVFNHGAYSQSYRKLLLSQKIVLKGQRLDFRLALQSVFGASVKLNISPFCAELESNTDFEPINQPAISVFCKDLAS